MTAREWTLDNEVYVTIDRGNGEFTSMPKAVWDELEAAKENGTISQKYELETIESCRPIARADRRQLPRAQP